MTEHQLLGLLLALSILVSMGGFISIVRMLMIVTREVLEARLLTGATLDIAREILREGRRPALSDRG